MTPELQAEIKQMVADRDAAMLTLDEATIRAYAARYAVELPDEPWTFWASVHFARVNLTNLPMQERSLSKRWLEENDAPNLLSKCPPEVP